MSTLDLKEMRKAEHLPWRSAYTDITKDHQEPFMLFGKSYCWTFLDENWVVGTTLRLVKTKAYHDKIRYHLSVYKVQGLKNVTQSSEEGSGPSV